jgi:hypothetical protein
MSSTESVQEHERHAGNGLQAHGGRRDLEDETTRMMVWSTTRKLRQKTRNTKNGMPTCLMIGSLSPKAPHASLAEEEMKPHTMKPHTQREEGNVGADMYSQIPNARRPRLGQRTLNGSANASQRVSLRLGARSKLSLRRIYALTTKICLVSTARLGA